MSQIFVTHTSAFLIHRQNRNLTYPDDFISTNEVPKPGNKIYAIDLRDFKRKYNDTVNNILEVLVTKNQVHKLTGFKFHQINGRLPNNSFAILENNVYIASPELVFCQLASSLPIEKLILIGMEMCGTYSIDLTYEKGFNSNRIPITSPEKITKYIAQLRKRQQKWKGIKKANCAAACLRSNSASPQESNLYTMLCAPTYLGGFGIKNAVMNQSITLSKSSSKLCGQKIIIPDISIPKYKIAIEYDSDSFHDNVNQNRKDKARIDALNYDKWKVFNFVPNQMHNHEAFYQLATSIIKATGKQARIRVKNFDHLQQNLHDRLFQMKK